MQVKVIGIGGIGLALLPTLSRYLSYSDEEATVTLIDGDQFEERNSDRQAFERLGNKAEVTAEELADLFPNLMLNHRDQFVTEANVVEVIRENDIVLLCVDNHATRKLVSDRCEDLRSVTLISGGNEFTDGNVQIHIRRDGSDLTTPIANRYHPEIEEPADQNPGEVGCDRLSPQEPQLVITNNAVAATMLNVFYAALQNRIDFDEVYVDVITGNSRSVRRSRSSEN